MYTNRRAWLDLQGPQPEQVTVLGDISVDE